MQEGERQANGEKESFLSASHIFPSNDNSSLHTCLKCGKDTKTWFGLGGKKFIGCSDIKCNYKQEVN